MRNGKGYIGFHMPRFSLMGGMSVFIICLTCFSAVFAGNKAHVEKKVEELDALNEAIMKKIDPLPENGIVEVSAEVVKTKKGNRIKVVEQAITIPVQRPEIQKN